MPVESFALGFAPSRTKEVTLTRPWRVRQGSKMWRASFWAVLALANEAGFVAAFAADKVPLQVALAGANKPTPKPPATSGKWRLTLNVGREQGTPMPAEWASSGARMLMSLDVDVLESPADEPDFDDLVGRGACAIVPRAREGQQGPTASAASFTGDNGEVIVPVRGGGWSFNDGKVPAKVRFWLDFDAAVRRDVELPAGPVFFASSVYKAEELTKFREDFIRARDAEWSAREALDNSPGGFDKLSAQGRLAVATANKQMCEQACPPEGELSQNPGDWPGQSSRVSIKRGLLSVKRGTFGFEYPTIGTWSAEPILEGVEAARAKRLYY